jgi:hypothetical protein
VRGRQKGYVGDETSRKFGVSKQVGMMRFKMDFNLITSKRSYGHPGDNVSVQGQIDVQTNERSEITF